MQLGIVNLCFEWQTCSRLPKVYGTRTSWPVSRKSKSICHHSLVVPRELALEIKGLVHDSENLVQQSLGKAGVEKGGARLFKGGRSVEVGFL